MDLSGPIHDFLLVFLGPGLIVGSLAIVFLPNPMYPAFSLGLVLFLYILILYSIGLIFCSCRTTPYLCRSFKYFIHFCYDVYEWFRILHRFSYLDYWALSYFNGLYKSFYFINYYYSLYVLVWDHLEYKIKSFLNLFYLATYFFLPFELVSIILLVTLIGAIAIAR